MKGFRFSKYTPQPQGEKSDFERLFKIFQQLVLITSGNVQEALQRLTEVDKQYGLTNPNYGIGDFIEDLKRKGFLKEGEQGDLQLDPKGEQSLRK